MTLVSSFACFRDRLRALDEIVRQLGLTIDDAPENGDGLEPAIVEALRAQTAELEHEIGETLRSFERHVSGATAAGCQQTVNRVWRAMQFELASYDALAELERVGAERGGAWQRWTAVVREVLERCAQTVYETADALALCWRELVETSIYSPGGIHG
ncbi:MAG TPA: hypothetical protein VGF69_22160 [Thermoanaerobaculia bacterium]